MILVVVSVRTKFAVAPGKVSTTSFWVRWRSCWSVTVFGVVVEVVEVVVELDDVVPVSYTHLTLPTILLV